MTTPNHINFISLGAGVQSSTMALMATHGKIKPMPDAAIFADTQWEPPAVYKWLDWLEKQLPFPVYRVTEGNLREDVVRKQNTTGGRYAAVPFHIIKPDGSKIIGRRQCTSEYKLKPLIREKRRLLGYNKGERVKKKCITWIGISIKVRGIPYWILKLCFLMRGR